ncbi:nitroreductase family deazaflavin-dependent oxidoreductase [Nocardioides euryhalodurans]|uniref:Nitroreductase family deazaflavin-dependent oxidoreductase n=1 Tax=Nocardioides euryhalodurans TaxID=2518370 RepID=A0A4P7GIG5_9ACTN|nr:nitroreductase family deazaflavin-dependent oxidoreductase [Nocardioides euryhalodurans]QBR91750.1 nitroreductase family deazaflavin-dependent oxidoreductase [Nocardioides euryhalodurans]
MGLAADLDYDHRTGNPVHRLGRWVGGTRAGGWVFSRSLRHLDDLVGRLSDGRHSAPGLLTGLAVLDLTTTGRRSGQRRTSHLIATPYDGTLALLGTNFGQEGTPAWALNLEAEPRATVSYRGTTREVVARPATAAEAEEIFDLAARFYVGYRHYRQRIGDRRRIRVFVLDPV